MRDTATGTNPPTMRELIGQRVKITFIGAGDHLYGTLSGVGEEALRLAGQIGGITLTDVDTVEPAPIYCESCGKSALQLFDSLCASCYRQEAARRPTPQEPCGVCGGPGVRQPGTDVFLCTTHHAEAGNTLRIGAGQSAVLAECATEDVTSPKHEWGQVRGARFRCIRCRNAEKWDSELLAQISLNQGKH